MAIFFHTPVLVNEVVAHLNLRTGINVVDCTVGLGGHSQVILTQIGPKGRLLGLEQDAENLELAKKNLAFLPTGQVILIHDNFSRLDYWLKHYAFQPIDAILFDLGLSSPHVEDASRGFSFMKEGPLDMRFDRSQGMTAANLINRLDEKRLAEIFRTLGEEPRAKRMAYTICQTRKKTPFKTTTDLVNVLPKKTHYDRIHPATRIFQALRMAVNQELEHLEMALHQAIKALTPGGRLAVIAYHSLEDRLVKNIFRYYTRDCICPKELPVCQCNFVKTLSLITKKPIIPSGIEVQENPRSRSAKLRIAEKIKT